MSSSGLQQLDNATRSKIRSTQILTSLPQIVSELVQNSLDAGAQNVEVGMFCSEWSCWIRDDGSGMDKGGLSYIAQGIEGGRYSSSKSYSPTCLDNVKTFGFRGEASAADLSCIEISSRTARSKESWSVILKGGEKLYYGPSLRWRRERAGTTVSIRDAFFNLPIRRLSHPSPARTLDLVKRELETLALIFPHVTFILRDESKDNHDGTDRSRLLTIPKVCDKTLDLGSILPPSEHSDEYFQTSSSLTTFRNLFGRAFVEHVDMIDAKSGSMKIEGFLSLVGSHSKSFQFLYVNRHVLDTCELHRVIEKLFSSSTFGKHASCDPVDFETPRPGSRRSPRKNDSRPIYVLNLTVPPREVDNCLEPSKSSVQFQNQDGVISFLANAIQSFLICHGFATSRSTSTGSDHLSKKRRRSGTDYGACVDSLSDSDLPCWNDMSGRSKREIPTDLIFDQLSHGWEDEEFTWVDPSTRRTYMIDRRTGNSYLRDQHCKDADAMRSQPRTMRRTISDPRWTDSRQSQFQRSLEGDYGMPDWIKQALESNDTFSLTERAIPCLPPSKSAVEGLKRARRVPWTRPDSCSALPQSWGVLGAVPTSYFTKTCLAGARFLAQVDRKFLACMIDTDKSIVPSFDTEDARGDAGDSNSRTLILIDQHAADERIRVERLLKPLCLGYLDRDGIGVERRSLSPPVPVLLTQFERNCLIGSTRMKKAFRNWGLDIIEHEPGVEGHVENENGEGYGMIHCSSVPEVVADKLVGGTGSDLRELVKGYLARLQTENLIESFGNNTDTTSPMTDVDEFAWLKALRHCPRELIELVNSRACRGAIMFNDQLSVEQCKRLLRQLSMMAFPFQCAHGRPSVVPLTSVRSQRDTQDSEKSQRAVDWGNLS